MTSRLAHMAEHHLGQIAAQVKGDSSPGLIPTMSLQVRNK